MIALIAVPMVLFVWKTREWNVRNLLIGTALASALSLALCLASLYAQTCSYSYAVFPSPSARAGNHGPGTLTHAGGTPVASLGAALSALFTSGPLELKAAVSFSRKAEIPSSGWKFWEAVDSHDLEEAAGGLVFFPRRPVLHVTDRTLAPQMSLSMTLGARAYSAAGKNTPSISEFLRVLEPLPPNGVIGFRVMTPSPDGGTQTVYYSPTGMDPVHGAGRIEEAAQVHFGFSGLPFLVFSPNQKPFSTQIYALGDLEIFGPYSFHATQELHPAAIHSNFSPGTTLVIRPRMLLLPRPGGNGFTTWLMAVPGMYVRQVLGLVNLPDLVRTFPYLPQQLYLLDDGFPLPVLLFRFSSITASLAMALA
ncbi:hypothetical protein EB061_12960, partial [bacterium]|nr:hypothetical protein [bacterium]